MPMSIKFFYNDIGVILLNEPLSSKPYIYLDWNVFWNLRREKRPIDVDCKEIINSIRKKYVFPYCEAHLLDLANNYKKENRNIVEVELVSLGQISDNYVLGETSNGSIGIIKSNDSPIIFFDNILKKSKSTCHIKPSDIPIEISKVDMRILDENHPMREILERTDGVIGSGILANFLNKLYEPFFSDKDVYKNFREYLKKVKDEFETYGKFNLQFNNELYNKLNITIMPLFESFEITDETILQQKWKDIVISFLRFSNTDAVFGHLITLGYMLLDLHPLFNEKLKKDKNTLSNITRDSKNVYYASSAKYLISEDQSFSKKVKFLYKSFNIKTVVIDIEEFTLRFSKT